MYGTRLQIQLIEPNEETAAQIVNSLALVSSPSPFAFEHSTDAQSAIESLDKPSPTRLVLTNRTSFDHEELNRRLCARQFPVVAYAASAVEYAELLELQGVFERVLLTWTVLDRLPALVDQWWHCWQAQQSHTAFGRQLPKIRRFTESLSVGACVVDRNRQICWSNTVAERLIATITPGSDGPHRIPNPATIAGISPIEIVREIRRRGRWQGELTTGPGSETRVFVTATCNTNSDGRITDFSILTQSLATHLSDQIATDMSAQCSAARSRLERLSPRERDVLQLVTAGYSNSDTANRLGLSKKTIEKHRARLMTKVAAGSLAELVQMVVTVNGGPTISLQEPERRIPENHRHRILPSPHVRHFDPVTARNL